MEIIVGVSLVCNVQLMLITFCVNNGKKFSLLAVLKEQEKAMVFSLLEAIINLLLGHLLENKKK